MEFIAGHLYRAEGQIYRAALYNDVFILYRQHEEGGAMLAYIPPGGRIGFVLEPDGVVRQIIQGPASMDTPAFTIDFEYVGVADTPLDIEDDINFREIMRTIDLE